MILIVILTVKDCKNATVKFPYYTVNNCDIYNGTFNVLLKNTVKFTVFGSEKEEVTV